MATSPAQIFVMENKFSRRAALALGLLFVVGFGLFNLLGITDIRAMPSSSHLHAVVMASWILLFVVQSYLGSGANLALHRKLGWVGAALALLGIFTAFQTGIVTTTLDRAPPVFYPPYFLALNFVQALFFGGFVLAAILMRKRTDWHRRLMLGAVVIVSEVAIGRLTIIAMVGILGGPESAIPFLAGKPWLVPLIEMSVQLLIVGTLMLRDRSIRGSVHPALKIIALAIPAFFATMWLLASVPAFAEYTFALKGSAL